MRAGRYPAYKESGVDWLSQVPAHWSLQPLGTLFTERRTTVSDTDFTPLSVTRAGVVPQLQDVAKTDNGDSRKLVKAGDFAINSRSDRKGSSGLADRDGSVSVITTVITPREMHPKYVHHLFRSVPFQEEYYRHGSGIVADLWSTRWPAMKGIRLAVPPPLEQLAIARFLDRETAVIDDFIADQEQLIDLLAERRAAAISHAVTKGLDPTARMKDSGIEWVDEIPAHWTVVTPRRLAPTYGSGTSVNSFDMPAEADEFGVLKTGSVSKGVFDPRENKRIVDDEVERATGPLRDGALLVNRANTPELVGAAGLVHSAPRNLFISDKLWQFDFAGASNRFMYYWTRSDYYRAQLRAQSVGASSSMQNMSLADFLGLSVVCPPLEEQERIADLLEGAVAEVEASLVDAREAIALSRERRAALIAAAVTGKIDVRGAA